LMGTYAKTAPIETFTATTNEHHPTDLAGLRGARLVTAVETEDGRHWAESKLKRLTGGDPIAARFMRQDYFEYVPQFKLLIAGNHKPSFCTVDEAIRRRVHLIPFTITIPEADRDQRLTEKLRVELGGILRWAIDGCLAWQAEGLNPPAVVIHATRDYLATEDSMGRWLEECCDVGSVYASTVRALFGNWSEWCRQNGEQEGSQKRFSQNLEARGYQRQRSAASRGFLGLAPKEATEDSLLQQV
jgi:putative DNA primase/helicase